MSRHPFLDDFLAEADELLAAVQLALLAIERQGQAEDSQRQALMRYFHTLKGLCGMVDLPEAVRLCHGMETEVQGRLDVDVLLDGTRALTDVIAPLRDPQARPPELTDIMARLSPEAPHAALSTEIWRGTFIPSAEKIAAGITIHRVREQVERQAKLLKVTPQVSGGAVRFEFEVAAAAAPEGTDIAWEKAAPEAPGPEPTAEAVPTLRVARPLIDELMAQVGELYVTHARLEAAVGGDLTLELRRRLHELRNTVVALRLVPVREVFQKLPLAVRDLARTMGHSVELDLKGEAVRVDKHVADALLDPLLHLVRNAISHGIESAERRAASGKPETGRLTVAAVSKGDTLQVTVEDDGRGIDLDALLRRARSVGLWTSTETPNASQMLDILCQTGFSTRAVADTAAGRGVGLDVVARRVRELGGRLSMTSTPGVGTTFRIDLPVMLTLIEACIVKVGAERYAVPSRTVQTLMEIETESAMRVGGGEVVRWNDRAMPLVRLARLLDVPNSETVGHGLITGDVVIGVERVVGLREIVVRPLLDPLVTRPGVWGATDLGDHEATLILDLPALLGADQ